MRDLRASVLAARLDMLNVCMDTRVKPAYDEAGT
jgi:hypothetical protein